MGPARCCPAKTPECQSPLGLEGGFVFGVVAAAARSGAAGSFSEPSGRE